MRLWLYLTLLVNAVVLIAFSAFGTFVGQERVRGLESEFKGDAQRLAQSLARSLESPLLTSSFDLIEESLLQQIAIRDLKQLMVASPTGKMIAHVLREPGGETRSLYLHQRMPFEPKAIETFGNDALTVVMPIRSWVRGEQITLGWLSLQVSVQRIARAKSEIVRWTAWAIVVTMTLTTAILMLVVGRVGRHIRQTTEYAKNLVGAGSAPPVSNSNVAEIHEINAALGKTGETLRAQLFALRDSESRKAAVLESSLDALVTMDSAGRIVDWNSSAEEMFGWRRTEAVGEDLAGLIMPSRHRSSHNAGLANYLKTGEGPVLGKRIEISALRRSGQEFPIELSVVAFSSDKKEYFLGSIRDIGQRRRLEAERTEINRKLEQAVDDLAVRQSALDEHAIVSMTDQQGCITYANVRFLAISQYPREELIGRNHRILRSNQHAPAFYEHMWATISQGQVWHGDICNRSKDGRDYWVASTIVPIKGAEGLPEQYISIRTDITQLKRIEQQLEMSAKSLGKLVDSYRHAQEEVQAAQTRELDIGHQIQKSMLFGNIPPRMGHVTLAAFTEPSLGIDGDFFEFVPYGEERFDVIIGDVMGKGVSAALIGAGVKQRINQVCAEQIAEYCLKRRSPPSPASIMNGLNARVAKQLADLSSFVTLAYLRVDLQRNTVNFVDAGHSQFILASGDSLRSVIGRNLPLGVLMDEVYESDEFSVRPGDLLFLYSDGFTEARNDSGEEFGLERLQRAIEVMHRSDIPVGLLIQALRKQVRSFEATSTPSDDRTCIVLQIGHAKEEGQKSLKLDFSIPWRVDALATMRANLHQAASDFGMIEDGVDALVLAAYEAATNLIRHAPISEIEPNIHVRIRDVGPDVELSYFYLGDPFEDKETHPDFSGYSEGGFGLFIIKSSVDEVRYESPAQGIAQVYMRKSKSARAPVSGASEPH